MNIIDNYFKLQQEIYDYFEFKEDWTVFPLDDRREYWWKINNDEEVVQGSKENIEENLEECFVDEIYKQRFYSKWVYKGKDYTMIMIDTHVDGNKFLAIYDNSKEIKE